MKQILQNVSNGLTEVIDCPAPSVVDGSVRISSKVSLISAGTERMLVDFSKSSLLSKAKQQPERVKQVIEKIGTDGLATTIDAVQSKLNQPIPLGYSNVGVISDLGSGVSGLKIGDRVVSNGPHADIVVVKKNLVAKIPDNVDDDSASFTVISSIALQGVRLAKPLLGETFVVLGVGLIGLLTVQILRANGCKVLAIDFDKRKLSLAESFGASVSLANNFDECLSMANSLSNGNGVDGVIITASTKSNDPIKHAATMCRKRGRVILVGVIGLNLDRSDFYEKEISFQVSCSYGPGRYDSNYEEKGQDYPIGFVRWTEQRNFAAVLDLMSSGSINVQPLITSRFNLVDANMAYEELLSNDSGLGILLDYDFKESSKKQQNISIKGLENTVTDKAVLGFIGAGNYASRVLMPAFRNTGAILHTVVTNSGINSMIHGKRMGFSRGSTDVDSIIKDPNINTSVIVTRHNTHADLVMRSLEAGKNVWVEKPLCIDMKSLQSIEKVYKNAHENVNEKKPHLMVGFNRRFAPHTIKMKQLIQNIDSPKSFIMTINAGYIPDDHWTQDSSIGGGRIIGEACHFIDLMRFLANSKIKKVHADAMSDKSSKNKDTASINLVFEDGSHGTILYLANGSSKFPKERIEIFVDNKILQLDNFLRLKGFGWPNFKKMNFFKQNKGHKECANSFIESLKTNTPAIPSAELFEVARVSLEVNDLLK